MIVKINYSNECRNQVFVKTGKVIDFKEVDVDVESLTAEERKILLEGTYASTINGKDNLDERTLNFRSSEYSTDVMDLIKRSNKAHQEAVEKANAMARMKNQDIVCQQNYKGGRLIACIYYATVDGRGLEFSAYVDKETVFDKNLSDIAEASREDIIKNISTYKFNRSGCNEEDLLNRFADAIIIARDKVIAEEAAEKAKKEEARKEKEALEERVKTKKVAWAQEHGSDYLRTLIQEGLQFDTQFFKEYTEWALNEINQNTGMNWELHEDPDNYSSKDIKEAEVSEDALEAYLKVKDVDGVDGIYIQEEEDDDDEDARTYLTVVIDRDICHFQMAIEL